MGDDRAARGSADRSGAGRGGNGAGASRANRNDRGRSVGNGPGRASSRAGGGRRRSGAGQQPTKRQVAPDVPRDTAYDVLRAVVESDAYANLQLAKLLRERELTALDAAFATELVFGTLRMQARIDAILRRCSNRPLDPDVATVLRMGSHQLLHMDVPTYAAVDTTVALTRRRVGPKPVSFVNAVLRRVAGRSVDEWIDEVAPGDPEDPKRWAVVESHPQWMVRSLAAALERAGRAPQELGDLLAANNRPAPVTLVARPGRITPAALAAQAGGELGRLSPWSVRFKGNPGSIAAVRDGRAGVQDEGSQLMALALSRARFTGPHEKWLDMCAGPGGKAAVLAGLAERAGAPLTAVELHPHRADLIRGTLGPDQDHVHVITGDATSTDVTGTGFSRVLLDAPCTGIGAVRRRPDLRWRRESTDVPQLVEVQGRLLDAAVASVAPGGVIAYVSCSPHEDETDGVVAGALARHPGIVQQDARPLLEEVADLGPGPAVRLWPHVHNTDGMYLALLHRT